MDKKQILVPTDFSKYAEIALKQSVLFANKNDCDVVLMHVIPSLKKLNGTEESVDLIHRKLQKLVDSVHSFCEVKVFTIIESGKVISQILKKEKEISPEYLFIGTDASANVNSSTTLQILNNVNCPLVVFSSRADKNSCNKIVLPLDLTKETKQKIEQTIRVAKIYGSEVHIVSAASLENDDQCDRLRVQLNQVKGTFSRLRIDCVTKIIRTKNDIEVMANAINDYADDINADLIVIMTRQETKIQKFFVGSMAIKLIRKSTVPIMCISPKV